MLLAFGWVDEQIAKALRITRPTLRKHYLSELRHRDEARASLEAEHKMMVYESARGGNVGAMKLLGHLIERDDLARLSQAVSDRGGAKPKPGKKEQLQEAAGNVTGKYAPPPAPRLLQ